MFSGDSQVPQLGERSIPLVRAWQHGLTAAEQLGLSFEMEPVSDAAGPWRCTLFRGGAPVPGGTGSGKGPEPAAKVGALFEALEHHLSSGVPEPESLVLCSSHAVIVADVSRDAALALLAEGPDAPLACFPYRSLTDGTERPLPVFMSMPDYVGDEHAAVRAACGDTYNYRTVCRYSCNNGWAAGTTPTEAAVHAINEIIERDAMSLLLVSQLLTDTPAPLPVIDPTTLPPDLAALHAAAQERTGRPVWLLEMTTDLGVPAYWAYIPSEPGTPCRVRGCGASLSARYAVERALSELIQIHAIAEGAPDLVVPRQDHTSAHPRLHRCHLADFSARGDDVDLRPFADTEAPDTPDGHLALLLDRLAAHGFTAWARERYVSEHLAVLNVFVPGLELFMLVTDGALVLPGPRGLAARPSAPVPS
ncbi:YcaO-like family protein [Streptomyces sp. NPDC001709]